MEPPMSMGLLSFHPWTSDAGGLFPRATLFSKLVEREIDFFDTEEVGTLTSRLGSDCQSVARVVGFHINVLVRNLLQCIGEGGACPPTASRAAFHAAQGQASRASQTTICPHQAGERFVWLGRWTKGHRQQTE